MDAYQNVANFPVRAGNFPVTKNNFPVNFRRENCLETAAAQGFFVLKSLPKASKLQNSLLISLLAGNWELQVETGSHLTAHTTTHTL
jgi:hypothetical protein